MNKRKILLLIIILLTTVRLMYCWYTLVSNSLVPYWNHYAALLLFIVPVFLFFVNLRKAVIASGVYLLLTIFNILSISPNMQTYAIGFTEHITTPSLNWLALGLFLLYLMLNWDELVDMYLDQKDHRLIKPTKKED